MAVPDAELLGLLRGVVGDPHVIAEPDTAAAYLTDWTGAWTGRAAVVRPADTEQVADVVRLCAEHGVAITPQGGNTGLVGGSVPAQDDPRPWVVLSTRRIDDVEPVDVDGRCIGAGSGAPLVAVQAAASAAGLALGVDLAARDSATVGGMVATNAGGIAMIAHGDMRAQILGIEAVLPSGEVLRRWRPLRKDNVGYHLPGLIAGSEGTLAVVTRVLLRLVDPPARTAVAVVAVADAAAANRVLAPIRRGGHRLEAAEIMTRKGIDLVVAHGARDPFPGSDAGACLLVELATDVTAAAELLDDVDGVLDAVVADGPARDLWALREAHTETIARSSTTTPVKLDVSVPLGQTPALIDWVDAYAARRRVRPVLFGHLGDGNIHVNLLDVPADQHQAVVDEVLAHVAAVGGSISAEHGIGRAKADHIGLGRGSADIATMRAVKASLDPHGVMNPGVVFTEH
ncbi:FAD-binding oxidoreductase [Gordonia sp. HY002]|uniref:FAD-binding oxidoreductase n=1 Tax=Gordonia zhenghanii TaxID=2911516 RepID=UPI001EF120FB|nr:FAD-binding oxidoreductase [Gordonia zhenghanii]MCF8571163.1 FAD-binding oxidoreductase [Gordonia zhenghanii]MCF8607179.1 FAD-binding oxidoreductase [Gordonia zhenghanii]